MSILNGKISASHVGTKQPPFGEKMRHLGKLAHPCMAVAALGEDIMICGTKTGLILYRIGKDGGTEMLSSLDGLSNIRQIAVCFGFAYVTARDCGVYVCDLRDPMAPKLVRTIDSLELATGVAAGGGLLAVTNRHMGCELYDIRDPEHLRRLGDFLCGEAQSVWLQESYAYIGDWINRQVRIFDIHDPAYPRECASYAVDGFADGVCVIERDGRLICLTATGHHAAKLKNRRKYQNFPYVTAEMLAEGYGCGHGVEVFDVTDPASPEWLATLKAPPMFGGPDTWRVYSDGKSCVFTDSMNGIFTIDLSNLTSPVYTGYYRLAPLAHQSVTPPSIQVQCAAITDCAAVGGILFAASDTDGVHMLQPVGELRRFVTPQPAFSNFAETKQREKCSDLPVFFCVDAQIHSFAAYNSRIYAAAGEAGIAVLDLRGNHLYTHPTPGICRDVIIHRGRLCAAEGIGGAACYEIGDRLTELGRVSGIGNVRQIVPTGDHLAAELGVAGIALLEIQDDGCLCATENECRLPMLYGRQLRALSASDRLLALPLSAGSTVLAAREGMRKISSAGQYFCPFADGACEYEGKLILIRDGSYYCLDAMDALETLPEGIRFPGIVLSGNPFVDGEKLILLNRCTGGMQVLDITDAHHPRFIAQRMTGLHPEFCGRIGDFLYAACGYDGIRRLEV